MRDFAGQASRVQIEEPVILVQPREIQRDRKEPQCRSGDPQQPQPRERREQPSLKGPQRLQHRNVKLTLVIGLESIFPSRQRQLGKPASCSHPAPKVHPLRSAVKLGERHTDNGDRQSKLDGKKRLPHSERLALDAPQDLARETLPQLENLIPDA